MQKKMDFSAILQGELIVLRPVKAEDFESLWTVASDPLIWEQHPEKDRYKKEVFRQYFDGAFGSIGPYVSYGCLVAIELRTGEMIGSSRYYDFDSEARTVAVGYSFLARNYWGGDYNLEMKKLMLKHAFQFVDKVLFHVGELNIRSQKSLEKIGARVLEKKIVNGSMHFVYEIDQDTLECIE
jgi:RimJ/RimL family protein N-acetyltransferase